MCQHYKYKHSIRQGVNTYGCNSLGSGATRECLVRGSPLDSGAAFGGAVVVEDCGTSVVLLRMLVLMP